MAKIVRHTGNLTPFAQTATSANRKVFGGTNESDVLDDNLTPEMKQGWGGVTGPTLWPSIQDFNAAMFTAQKLIAYLMQQGVAEYDPGQEYHENSMCSSGGQIYVSKQDNNTGELLTDDNFWQESLTIPDLSIVNSMMTNSSIALNNMKQNSVSTGQLVEHAVGLGELLQGSDTQIIGFDNLNNATLIGAPLGIKQTWFSYSLIEREPGILYTNNTGRTIAVVMGSDDEVDNDVVDGIAANDRFSRSYIIPPSSSYRSEDHNRWMELRDTKF